MEQEKSKKFIEDLNNIGDLQKTIDESLKSTKQIKIGNFVILQLLGGGNYGQVYQALHSINKKYFAIKIIDKKKIFATVDSYVKGVLTRLLESEGILMQMCHSPYVLKCYDIIENQRYKILILEYCNRKSLHDELKKKKSFPINQALAIFKQIINGLSELHKNKIVHRDLKPENIMINNGTYKIADFGFSRIVKDQYQIGQFTCLGTRTTMAPEVRDKQKYGIKADIWSLGIIFYMMICSNISYNSEGYMGRSKEINRQIKKSAALYIVTVDGVADNELVSFIESMLKINQEQRISWKQLLVHPIFKRCENRLFNNPVFNPSLNEALSNVEFQPEYIEVFYKNLPQEIDLKKARQSMQMLALGDKRKQKMRFIESQIREQLNETINIEIEQMKQQYIDFALPEVSDQERKRYEQIKKNNLQCLKALYIYEKILLGLENKKMLDLKRKSHNQFLFMLINRCKTNLSWSRDYLSRNSDDQMFVNYHEHITVQYNIVQKKWNQIQQRLFDISNETKYKLLDYKNALFNRQEKKIIETFQIGIENLDYNKEKQLWYTQNHFIERILDQIKGQPNELHQMKTKLRCYKKINQIQLKELEEIDFYQKVAEIILKAG